MRMVAIVVVTILVLALMIVNLAQAEPPAPADFTPWLGEMIRTVSLDSTPGQPTGLFLQAGKVARVTGAQGWHYRIEYAGLELYVLADAVIPAATPDWAHIDQPPAPTAAPSRTPTQAATLAPVVTDEPTATPTEGPTPTIMPAGCYPFGMDAVYCIY